MLGSCYGGGVTNHFTGTRFEGNYASCFGLVPGHTEKELSF